MAGDAKKSVGRALFAAAAAPASVAYGGAVRLRRALYDWQIRPVRHACVPVVSVGGLEAGGSGKTPVSAWLLAHLQATGWRPGLATRGYGRRTQGLIVRRRGALAGAQALGDEAAMLVHAGYDVDVAACASRYAAAQALAAAGCDIVVLDDGFVHRALHRDLNIVVLRAEAPFGGGRWLPWGTLREPPSSLGRADVVWLHHKTSAAPTAAPPWWSRWCPRAEPIVSRAVPQPIVDTQGRPVAAVKQSPGPKVIGAAGIAWPQQFAQTLRDSGAQVLDFLAFPDHHSYSPADINHLVARQKALGAAAVVVTPKDAVKLAALWPSACPLWILGTTVVVEHGEDRLASRLKALQKHGSI